MTKKATIKLKDWTLTRGLCRCGFFLQKKRLIYSLLNSCLVWLQVYQLQTELQKTQIEKEFQRQRSVRSASLAETPKLQEEVRRLRSQLVKAEKLDPVSAITSAFCVIS